MKNYAKNYDWYTLFNFALTLHEGCSKTGQFQTPVREELDIELAGVGLDVLRHVLAAVSADEG